MELHELPSNRFPPSSILCKDGFLVSLYELMYNTAYFIPAIRPTSPQRTQEIRWSKWIGLFSIMIILIVLYYDIRTYVSKAVIEATVEIEVCKEEYQLNECDPSTRIPVAKDHCKKMEACMQLDPFEAALKTVASVGLLSNLVNILLDSLSLKSISVLGVLAIATIYFYIQRRTQ